MCFMVDHRAARSQADDDIYSKNII